MRSTGHNFLLAPNLGGQNLGEVGYGEHPQPSVLISSVPSEQQQTLHHLHQQDPVARVGSQFFSSQGISPVQGHVVGLEEVARQQDACSQAGTGPQHTVTSPLYGGIPSDGHQLDLLNAMSQIDGFSSPLGMYVPKVIKDRIWKGEFVEFADLLPHNRPIVEMEHSLSAYVVHLARGIPCL